MSGRRLYLSDDSDVCVLIVCEGVNSEEGSAKTLRGSKEEEKEKLLLPLEQTECPSLSIFYFEVSLPRSSGPFKG